MQRRRHKKITAGVSYYIIIVYYRQSVSPAADYITAATPKRSRIILFSLSIILLSFIPSIDRIDLSFFPLSPLDLSPVFDFFFPDGHSHGRYIIIIIISYSDTRRVDDAIHIT